MAVVIGLDSLQGLQTARILRGHGIDVYAIAADHRHPACSTNCCEDIIFCDTGSTGLLPVLECLGQRVTTKAVLFPCQDKCVRIVSEYRERLPDQFLTALPRHDTAMALMDKDSFERLARQQGLPVPGSWHVGPGEDPRKIASAATYPCLLKPIRRSAEWDRRTRKKVFLVHSPDELLQRIEQCREFSSKFVVQQWIAGNDDCLYSCNAYFGKDGKALSTFVARKLRQWPTEAGSSCLGEEVRDDTVLDTTLKLFGGLDYHGLAYLEMKRDAVTGKYFVIEPNICRPTGRSAIAEGGGVELLYTMYCDVLDRPLPERRTQRYAGTKWLDLRHDLQSAFSYWRRGQLTIPQWLRSLRGPKTHAILSWRDPKPFLLDLRNAVGLSVTRGRIAATNCSAQPAQDRQS